MAIIDRTRYRKTYVTLKRTRRYVKTYPDVIQRAILSESPFAPDPEPPPPVAGNSLLTETSEEIHTESGESITTES